MAKYALSFILTLFSIQSAYSSVIEYSWNGQLYLLEGGIEKDEVKVTNSLIYDDENGEITGLSVSSDIFNFRSNQIVFPTFEMLSNEEIYWYLGSFEFSAVDLVAGLQWTIALYDFNIFLPEAYALLGNSPLEYLDEAHVSIYTTIFDGSGISFSGFTGENIRRVVSVIEPNSFLIFLSGLILLFWSRFFSLPKFNSDFMLDLLKGDRGGR
ncbi:hypothetical protein FWJ25_06680 [Marinobacter salinexigens]|uniref:Uncharacterized protein n=1 Tax=Marinobacter salinexigens TaxID=2919747 RepID=A0A5B0VK07_9GAMM|nr:hypothetical protein [Marinobacter salinexigens]KAA1175050.1 hypothetical protein FWJ25_06680 [Marinobacter salinexigens]